MKSIEIDRSKQLRDQPETGHNRWHPDIPPLLEVDEGEEVVLETRDALDGQFKASTTLEDFANIEVGLIHPLTGPVFLKGAEPGDLLEIEFVEIRPVKFAWTAIIPGFGFLRDLYTTPFFVPWTLGGQFRNFARDSWRPDSGSSVHGHDRYCALACPGGRVEGARRQSDRRRRRRTASGSRRGRASVGTGGGRRIADAASP